MHMMKGILINGFSVLLLSLCFFIPHVSAASCRSSAERDIEERYDDAVSDFDHEALDLGITSTIYDIEDGLDRGGAGALIDAAIREVDDDIEDLERFGERLYDRIIDMHSQSRYEDCGTEVRRYASDFHDYFMDIIIDFRRDLERAEGYVDDIDNRRNEEIRAPVWHWGEESPSEPKPEIEPEPEPIAPRVKSAAQIRTEIFALIAKIQTLLFEYALALERER